MNSLKTELWKATHNRMFFLSLLIGCLLCAVDTAQTAVIARHLLELTQRSLEMDLPVSINPAGDSVFVKWMALGTPNFGSRVFHMIWPILAAMPYGSSLCTDLQSGYENQAVTRCGRRAYFRGKFLACFVSGGLAVSLPVILNLLLGALICPAWTPEVELLQSSIGNGYFLGKLFYTKPWAFSAVWCAVDFLWGGTAACLCLTLGGKVRHSFLVTLFPFGVFFTATAVIAGLDHFFRYSVELSPLYLALPDPGRPNPWWVIFPEILLLSAMGAGVGYWQVKKHELS